MTPSGAYISLQQIADSYLVDMGKTSHVYYRAIKLAASAVEYLTVSGSLPMIHTRLLTRPDGQTYWSIPDDYTAWAGVSVLNDGVWSEVTIREGNYSPETFGTGEYDSEFGDEYGGAVYASQTTAGQFNPANFSTAFNTAGSTTIGQATQSRYCGISINTARRIILFGGNTSAAKIQLSYVGIGTADEMTKIPREAKFAIAAYIKWKWVANKRGGTAAAAPEETAFLKEEARLRAMLNPLDIESIRDSVFRGRLFNEQNINQ